VGCADQGERRVSRLTWFETAAQIYLGEGFTMICVDARHADKTLYMKVNKTDGGPRVRLRERHQKKT
jgi:hypothetical protein